MGELQKYTLTDLYKRYKSETGVMKQAYGEIYRMKRGKKDVGDVCKRVTWLVHAEERLQRMETVVAGMEAEYQRELRRTKTPSERTELAVKQEKLMYEFYVNRIRQIFDMLEYFFAVRVIVEVVPGGEIGIPGRLGVLFKGSPFMYETKVVLTRDVGMQNIRKELEVFCAEWDKGAEAVDWAKVRSEIEYILRRL